MSQAALARLDLFHSQGSNSGSRLCGISAMRASTSASQASGSMSLSFAVMISVVTAAARSAPRSEPAKSHDLRPRAIAQSFCPYRAGCCYPLPLASAVWAECASHSGRAARNRRVRPYRADVGRCHDRAGMEARPGLLCRPQSRSAAGLSGRAFLLASAARGSRIAALLCGHHRH